MSVNADLQMALAKDAGFRKRLEFAAVQIALQVCAEAGTVPNHAARRLFAAKVLGDSETAAKAMAATVVSQVNLTAPVTTVNYDLSVTSGATDAAIASQVFSLWDALSGV